MTASQELMVISGASTGMGAATARELAGRGYHVLAGVRRERDADAIRAAGIEPVLLDITDPDQVAALADRIATDPQGRPLRAVINNAGVSVNAPVETFPLSEWRKLYEVNLFGHVAMIQALLPFLHRSRGRIVNISSLGGRMALASYGPYAGTKFALEGISDALRRELAPHGVQVVVVEPGAVQTAMGDRGMATTTDRAAQMTSEQQRLYGPLMRAVVDHARAHLGNGRTAEQAAAVIAKAATARRPRTRYPVGPDAAVLVRLARIIPDRLLDRIAAGTLRPYLTDAAAEPTAVPRQAGQPVADAAAT